MKVIKNPLKTNWSEFTKRPEIERNQKLEARWSFGWYFGAGPAESADPAEALELASSPSEKSLR